MNNLNPLHVLILETIEEIGPVTYSQLEEKTGQPLKKLYAATHPLIPNYLETTLIYNNRSGGKPRVRLSATVRGFAELDKHRES